MEVDIHDSQASVSPSQPSQNVGYSTLLGRDISERIQKAPEGRVLPERNLFSQDISVKMASELLFQLSGKSSATAPQLKLKNEMRVFCITPKFYETVRSPGLKNNRSQNLPTLALETQRPCQMSLIVCICFKALCQPGQVHSISTELEKPEFNSCIFES